MGRLIYDRLDCGCVYSVPCRRGIGDGGCWRLYGPHTCDDSVGTVGDNGTRSTVVGEVSCYTERNQLVLTIVNPITLECQKRSNGLLVLTGLQSAAKRIVGLCHGCDTAACSDLMIGKRLRQLLLACSVIGTIGTAGGLLLSMTVDIPSGASMTAVAVALLISVALAKSILDKIKAKR